MAFTAEIVFAGLCLFCIEKKGCHPPYEQTQGDKYPGTVYLVNASSKQSICGHPVDGGHETYLSFHAADVLNIASQIADDVHFHNSPKGERIGLLDIKGREICFKPRWSDPCCFCGAKKRELDMAGGASVGQKKPHFLKPDADDFDWLVSVKDVDDRVGKLRNDVEKDIFSNPYVASRVRLEYGKLETFLIGKYKKNYNKGDYILWDSKKYGSTSNITGFPRVLGEQVVLRMRCLEILQVQDCSGKSQKILIELQRPRGKSHLVISNLPPNERFYSEQTEQEHFRHYYRLFDNADKCPQNVPAMPSGGDGFKTALGETTYCSPASAN